jgi:hypothetical protein
MSNERSPLASFILSFSGIAGKFERTNFDNAILIMLRVEAALGCREPNRLATGAICYVRNASVAVGP